MLTDRVCESISVSDQEIDKNK